MARTGATAVSDSFDVEEVVFAVSFEASTLVALTVAMVGARAVPAVAVMNVDASAAIVGGNKSQNGCGGRVWLGDHVH